MKFSFSRRDLMQSVPAIGLATGILTGVSTSTVCAETLATSSMSLWTGYPKQDQKLVAEVVGSSHFNEQRVKELVKAYPELVNAWWDWGFGDWESPLGAASHVGQRGIAEYLLGQGARIDIFAAAMLGLTDVVKAFVKLQPGIQRTLGPHGITLLAHAKAGGKQAADTVAYLETLGDAGQGLKVVTLEEGHKQRYLGEFVSKQPDVKAVCKLNNTKRLVVDFRAGESESTGRLIHYLGDDAFFPAGVPSVRIRFKVENEKAAALTIQGSVPTLTLQAIGN